MKNRKKKLKPEGVNIILLIIFILILCSLFYPNYADLHKYFDTREHVVESGESLWGIALDIRQEGQSTRKIIEEIKELNKLETVVLQVNQVLVIPQY